MAHGPELAKEHRTQGEEKTLGSINRKKLLNQAKQATRKSEEYKVQNQPKH